MDLWVRTDMESGVGLVAVFILVPQADGSVVKNEVLLWWRLVLDGAGGYDTKV